MSRTIWQAYIKANIKKWKNQIYFCFDGILCNWIFNIMYFFHNFKIIQQIIEI